MEKKAQKISNPSLHDNMILLISGTPGVGDQFLKVKEAFSLFSITDQN